MTLYRPICYFIEPRTYKYFSRGPRLFDHVKINCAEKNLYRERFLNSRGFKNKVNSALKDGSLASGGLSLKNLVKPLFFTLGFSTTTYVGCTIWHYENERAKAKTRYSSSLWPNNGWFQSRNQVKQGSWRQKCNDFWSELSEGQKMFAPVLLANILVFAAWRVPKWQPVMVKYFGSNPAAKVVCWPMVLSTFSHYSIFHFAANMFVLHSFSHSFVASLGKEQAAAVYLSAGVISSFSSVLYKVLANRPGLSIGASGAIMAILGFVCMQYPDAKLSIIFLPMFTFSAGAAIKVAVGVDLVGCILGWKFFDHAAHLGGALFGIGYAYWGHTHILKLRYKILQGWHTLRNPTTTAGV